MSVSTVRQRGAPRDVDGFCNVVLGDPHDAMAGDSHSPVKKCEASMLLVVVESHLCNEDFEEAITSASQALALFQAVNDTWGIVAAQRAVVRAYCGKASRERSDGHLSRATGYLFEAESLVYEHLDCLDVQEGRERVNAERDLILAEVKCARGDDQHYEEALELVEESLACFTQASNARLKGMACMILSKIRLQMKQILAAKRAAGDAVKIFKEFGDWKQEAYAWERLSTLAGMNFCYEEALRCGRKQLKIGLEHNDTVLQASAHQNLAHWSLCKGDGRAALSSATNLLAISSASRRDHELTAANLLVEAHLLLNSPEEAIEIAIEHVDRFRSSGNQRELQGSLHHLALAYQASGRHEECLETTDEASEICVRLDLKPAHVQVLETMAYTYVQMNRYADARRVVAEASELRKIVGDRVAESKTLMFVQARILILTGDYTEAVKSTDEALRVARDVGDRALEGQALLAVCVAQGTAKNFDKALQAGEFAADVFHEVGGNYRIDEAKTWQTLSEMHLAMGEPSQALKCILQSEALLANFGDQRRLARMKHTRVRILLSVGSFGEAAKVGMESLKIARAEDDLYGIVQALFLVIEANVESLGEVADSGERPKAVLQQLCDKTLRFAKECVAVSVRLVDKRSEGAAYGWLAHIHIMSGRFSEAQQAAQSASTLYKEIGDKSGEAHANSLLAQADMHNGNGSAAVDGFQKALALAKEVGDDQLITAISEMQSKVSGKRQVLATAYAKIEDASVIDSELAASTADAGGAVATFVAPDPEMIKSFMVGLVQQMTGGSEDVDVDTPLMESGIDSLASVELRTQLQTEFRLSLPSTVMFNYPTISTMTDLLVEELTSKKISWEH